MARLVFLDESGFLPAPLARRGWAPAGQTPVLYQRGRHHKKVSAVAALCVSPERRQVRLYFRLYPGKEVGTGRGIAFLKALDRELDANGCLVRDRLNAHRANQTRAYLETASRLPAFFFPSCAPEPNPVEYLWSWMKRNPMANRAMHYVDPLADATRRCARSMQSNQDLLRSLIEYSTLSLRLQ